jgi:hypothetical protein
MDESFNVLSRAFLIIHLSAGLVVLIPCDEVMLLIFFASIKLPYLSFT